MSNETPKTLTVTESELRTDKNGKKYNYFRVSTPTSVIMNVNGVNTQVAIQPRTSAMTAYPESYLPDGSPQFGHNFSVGQVVLGDIVTRYIELTFIPDANNAPQAGPHIHQGQTGRFVNKASAIVFGDSTDSNWEIEVGNAFQRRGFIVRDTPAEIPARATSGVIPKNAGATV